MAAEGISGVAPESFVVRDVATLKVLADPLRQDLLAMLDAPRTVRELADIVGRAPDRLYYHLDLMERRGLIRSSETRGAERRYCATAPTVEIDPDFAMPPAVTNQLVASILQRAQREYMAAAGRRVRDGKKRVLLGLVHVELTEKERAELVAQLSTIGQDHEERAKATPNRRRRPYGILTGMWPIAED